MYRLTIEEQFEDLRNISELVDDYLNRELYIADFGADTDYSPNQILLECYGIIIDELAEFGIHFNVDEDVLLHDWYTAKELYFLRAFLDSDNLLKVLTTRGQLETLGAIILDSNESELFRNVVDFIFNKRESDIYIALSDLFDWVTVSDEFGKHIADCILRIEDTGAEYDVSEEDMNKVREYLIKVSRDRDVVNRGYDYLLGTHPFPAYLNNLAGKAMRDNYDVDKILPENITKYAIVDRDDYIDQVERRILVHKHHASTPYHIEFYKKRPELLDHLAVIFILLAILEPDGDADEFADKAKRVINQLSDITTDEQLIDFAKLTRETLVEFHHCDEE